MDSESAHMVAVSKVLMLKPRFGFRIHKISFARRYGFRICTYGGCIQGSNAQTCSETLDQNFDRLQKLVSQLEVLGEKLSQEDMNQKLLRSLSPEWN
ncbi:hypothetical protein Tco_0220446, partial [Tanacetum coccineum]